MGPEMICEGCGRHWSDPVPANCPECGEVFWVMEEQTIKDQPGDYVDTTGYISMTTTGPFPPYYCGECNIFHKADSGIGLRHRPE